MGRVGDDVRSCPICGGKAGGKAFPYKTRFNSRDFMYLRCTSCTTVFVDPVPDAATFHLMYAKSNYHDCHYEGIDQRAYAESVGFLARHLTPGKRVLDYGCGSGYFLKACVSRGYEAIGIEFDPDEARAAGELAACKTYSVEAFQNDPAEVLGSVDAIHMGDVLEHLPNPIDTLSILVSRLPVGGVVFIEGPIELNPSPVYWAAATFGTIKHWIRPSSFGTHPPTHLLRTDSTSQRNFFTRLGEDFHIVAWQIEETGWPYGEGGLIKKAIARCAVALGGRRLFGTTFGNRFRAILVKVSTQSTDP